MSSSETPIKWEVEETSALEDSKSNKMFSEKPTRPDQVEVTGEFKIINFPTIGASKIIQDFRAEKLKNFLANIQSNNQDQIDFALKSFQLLRQETSIKINRVLFNGIGDIEFFQHFKDLLTIILENPNKYSYQDLITAFENYEDCWQVILQNFQALNLDEIAIDLESKAEIETIKNQFLIVNLINELKALKILQNIENYSNPNYQEKLPIEILQGLNKILEILILNSKNTAKI